MASLCKFYQRGSCHHGQNCRFIHPGENTLGGPGSTGNFSNNAFGTIRQTGFDGSNSGGGAQTKLGEGFNLPTQESIKTDLTERPTWYLSSYAPGKDPPAQLIDGKDISPEEARVLAYKCRAEGNLSVYEAEWTRLTTEADTQIRIILNDLPGAVNFMKNAYENRTNSRYNSSSTLNLSNIPSPFGNPEQSSATFTQTPAFSQQPQVASVFGQPSRPTSAFGQLPQPTSTFSSPSPFTIRPTPAFGQSAFGQPAFSPAPAPQPQNPFGQSAFSQSPLTKPAFGQPAFGQPSFGQPAFGQPPVLGHVTSPFATATSAPTATFRQIPTQQQTPAFGQPSAFGTPSLPKLAFSQPSFGTSPFVQSSPFATNVPAPQGQSQAPSPFAQQPPQLPNVRTPFGYVANQNATTPSNTFQQAAARNNPSPFSSSNPFQQGQQATNNPFPQTTQTQPSQQVSTFGQPTASVSVFGVPQQPPSFNNQNPFQSAQQQQPASHQVNPQLQEAQKHKKWDDPIIEYMQIEKDAFSAPAFTLGYVPTVAPSREMCWG